MEEFLSGVSFGISLMIVTAILFGIIILIYYLAKSNYFFTFVQEGRAKAIMKFNRFHRIVMSYEGHGLDYEWNVRETGAEDGEGHIIPLRRQFRIGGLMWVGIPFVHSVYDYEFRWASFEQTAENGKLVQKVIPHEQRIDHILVQDDVYYTFVEKAETKGMVPVDAVMLLTIRITNPYKALFRIQNWLEATLNQTRPALREFIGSKQFEELVSALEGSKEKEMLEKEFNGFLKASAIDEFVREEYGVDLRKAGIATIDPAGDRGINYVEAASKKWEAQREKERIETIADAEVERLRRVYGQIKDYGDEGLFIRATEAIERAGKGPSNLVIFPFGTVQSMFEGWLGKRRNARKEKENEG